jgi:hypothetical protein
LSIIMVASVVFGFASTGVIFIAIGPPSISQSTP